MQSGGMSSGVMGQAEACPSKQPDGGMSFCSSQDNGVKRESCPSKQPDGGMSSGNMGQAEACPSSGRNKRQYAASTLTPEACLSPSESCILYSGFFPKGFSLRHAGFSMVEVSVAIAVMAFGVIAIIGIFAISLGGSKDSVTDSVISLKSMDILANAKGDPFNNVTLGSGVPSFALSAESNQVAVYYDNSGLIRTGFLAAISSTVAQTEQAAYAAQIITYSTGWDYGSGIVYNDALTNNPLALSIPPSTNTALLQVFMIHPATAPAAQQITNFFQTIIVNRNP